MDNWTLWILYIFAAITLYRLISRRASTPQARVTAMLRRYRALEKAGLPEQERLVRLLATRRYWQKLPPGFLTELASRLGSKEDVMRFVTVSEDYGYHRDHYPGIAAGSDLDAAMSETACLFARFGFKLQAEGRYKEAEFVQKLALRVQPEQYFTNLPLAATYHETGRHADALPLFERGLARFQEIDKNLGSAEPPFSPVKCLAPDAEIRKLRNRYKKMYQACLKAAEGKPLSGFSLLPFIEMLG